MEYLIKKYLIDNEKSGTPGIDFKLQNNGEGIFISYWNEQKLGEKPSFSQEQLTEGLVQEKILEKLIKLDNYHFYNLDIRQCKINNYFILQLSGEGRSLIQEQITLLEQQIKLNLVTEADGIFEYFYNGGSIEISLVQLRQLYVEMLDIVNSNYQNYKAETYLIKNLSTIEAVEGHDFTLNYLKNQNITL